MTEIEKFNKLLDEAVFAQLRIHHAGTSYDETLELFRTNNKGERITNWIDIELEDGKFTIGSIYLLGVNWYNRNMANIETVEELTGFTVDLILDGGGRVCFTITTGGKPTNLREDWYKDGNPLNINEIIGE